ncbi:HepT-like ribonuclease domain-containing protein [Dinghuibacter silviterrae]|uniref:Uncharacterized protein with HEPN domain n=1 Tax=Dinghuibacter silviterrae TaxID=1539049 RepID=A0A4R8DIA0_9BACT|nr:HepT-like ribonuclease domain-containing protein [Dinghuibacter silviterrae]TDW97461.1 uncharacterized protein with HEPN domain [Dinghuibacter silviterrae]
MSERDTPSLLQDILEAIGNIKAFTQGLTLDTYKSDLKTKHAVERNFAIIGEAVARIDASYKSLHSDIDWRQVKDFRNILVHDYFGIDDAIVWEIIQMDLNMLDAQIRGLLL